MTYFQELRELAQAKDLDVQAITMDIIGAAMVLHASVESIAAATLIAIDCPETSTESVLRSVKVCRENIENARIAIGSDRSQWPTETQRTVARLEAKHKGITP